MFSAVNSNANVSYDHVMAGDQDSSKRSLSENDAKISNIASLCLAPRGLITLELRDSFLGVLPAEIRDLIDEFTAIKRLARFEEALTKMGDIKGYLNLTDDFKLKVMPKNEHPKKQIIQARTAYYILIESEFLEKSYPHKVESLMRESGLRAILSSNLLPGKMKTSKTLLFFEVLSEMTYSKQDVENHSSKDLGWTDWPNKRLLRLFETLQSLLNEPKGSENLSEYIKTIFSKTFLYKSEIGEYLFKYLNHPEKVDEMVAFYKSITLDEEKVFVHETISSVYMHLKNNPHQGFVLAAE